MAPGVDGGICADGGLNAWGERQSRGVASESPDERLIMGEFSDHRLESRDTGKDEAGDAGERIIVLRVALDEGDKGTDSIELRETSRMDDLLGSFGAGRVFKGASNADSIDSSSWDAGVDGSSGSRRFAVEEGARDGRFISPNKSNDPGSNASNESNVVDQSSIVGVGGSDSRSGGTYTLGFGRGGGIDGILSISGLDDVFRTIVTVDTVRRSAGGSWSIKS